MKRKLLFCCPWCASTPVIIHDHEGYYRVRCSDEKCTVHPQTGTYHTREEAMAVWDNQCVEDEAR